MVVFIHDSNSLKERRMVLHSIKARLRNEFNVSVAQVDDEDKWQKATLAMAGVGKDRATVDSCLSKVLNYLNDCHRFHVIEHEMELL